MSIVYIAESYKVMAIDKYKTLPKNMEREKLFDFLISIYWKLIIKTTPLLFYFFLTLEEIHE